MRGKESGNKKKEFNDFHNIILIKSNLFFGGGESAEFCPDKAERSLKYLKMNFEHLTLKLSIFIHCPSVGLFSVHREQCIFDLAL